MTTATVIDGKAFAAAVAALVAEDAAQLTVAGVPPTLAVILVGDDPASGIYVRNKAKRAEHVGVRSHVITLPASATTAQVLAEVVRLNNDSSVHGILVQLPLPKQVSTQAVIEAIAPEKDVDGFHPVNVGRLTALGPSQARVPCTPLGAWLLLRHYCGDLTGKQAVVIGRSNIVGKPMASLLLHESCTVIQAHSRTVDTATLCRAADIIVACVGKPGLVRADWVKDGATLIDVGINRVERDGGYVVCGDIDEAACARAANYTPVPGGIGPMTIACLLANTVCACVAQREDDTAGYALMNTYVTRLTRR